YRLVVILGARVGLRWGEMLGLRRADVDVLRNRVHVRQTVTQTSDGFKVGPPKTKGSKRTVPVARAVMTEIVDHLDAYVPSPSSARLLSGLRGEWLHRGTFNRGLWRPALVRAGLLGEVVKVGDEYRAGWQDANGDHTMMFPTEAKAVAKAARASGEGLRVHDLRHSYASWLISAGASVKQVSAWMGHSSVAMTLDTYTHLFEADGDA